MMLRVKLAAFGAVFNSVGAIRSDSGSGSYNGSLNCSFETKFGSTFYTCGGVVLGRWDEIEKTANEVFTSDKIQKDVNGYIRTEIKFPKKAKKGASILISKEGFTKKNAQSIEIFLEGLLESYPHVAWEHFSAIRSQQLQYWPTADLDTDKETFEIFSNTVFKKWLTLFTIAPKDGQISTFEPTVDAIANLGIDDANESDGGAPVSDDNSSGGSSGSGSFSIFPNKMESPGNDFFQNPFFSVNREKDLADRRKKDIWKIMQNPVDCIALHTWGVVEKNFWRRQGVKREELIELFWGLDNTPATLNHWRVLFVDFCGEITDENSQFYGENDWDMIHFMIDTYMVNHEGKNGKVELYYKVHKDSKGKKFALQMEWLKKYTNIFDIQDAVEDDRKNGKLDHKYGFKRTDDMDLVKVLIKESQEKESSKVTRVKQEDEVTNTKL